MACFVYFVQSYDAEKGLGRDASVLLQVYMGIGWSIGCATIGLLIVREPTECRIGRQYLCQVSHGLFACFWLSARATFIIIGRTFRPFMCPSPLERINKSVGKKRISRGRPFRTPDSARSVAGIVNSCESSLQAEKIEKGAAWFSNCAH